MAEHNEFGRRAETLAEAYFRNLGYEILDKNLRYRFGEIDLLARDKDELVVIEVRARRVGSLQSPIESLSRTKLRRLVRAAEVVLAKKTFGFKGLRIDVLAWEGSVWKHYPHVHHEGLF